MARMSEIDWEPCLLTQHPAPELERRFAQETGRSGEMMRFFAASPWAADALVRVSVQIDTTVTVDPHLVDQAGLVVSQDNSCRFCFGMQRAFLRVLGMSENRIARLEQDLLTGDFSPRERAALEFARRLSQSKPVATLADLEPMIENGFAPEAIVEFAGLVGLHLFMNRMATFVALPPQRFERYVVGAPVPALDRDPLSRHAAQGKARGTAGHRAQWAVESGYQRARRAADGARVAHYRRPPVGRVRVAATDRDDAVRRDCARARIGALRG